MKCATSTLYRQLGAQPGLFMARPKEPSFFSRSDCYALGPTWYAGLFRRARAGDLCGEASTHYTKLPKYGRTVQRMRRHLPPHTRFLYLIRHPVDRLVSQFLHEWSDRTIDGPLDQAIERYPRLVDYGRYAYQLRPYLETFGPQRVLVAFFEQVASSPQAELSRIAAFLGYRGPTVWHDDVGLVNASTERSRRAGRRRWDAPAPGSGPVRPCAGTRREVARARKLPIGRPAPTPTSASRLEAIFDEDLERLGSWLGHDLSCATFRNQALAYVPPAAGSFPGFR